MQVKKNHSLKNYNTFGVDVKTKYFAEIKNLTELKEVLIQYSNEKILILGEGSNTLLVDDWDGITLKISIKGKKILTNHDLVDVEVNSGENWNDFVEYTIKQNLSGVENMVLIPGTVGAAVAQNIGAYGQEVVDIIQSVKVIDIKTCKLQTLLPKDCDFSYRNTKFKNEWKDKYIILSSIFRLKKYPKGIEGERKYNEDISKSKQYEGLLEELKLFAKQPYGIKDVSQAVKNLRRKKLPLLDEYGSCGCFFANPIIKQSKYEELKKQIPNLVGYPMKNDLIKISAGKLLDELGWKGRWENGVGVYDKHALCVITNRDARGEEIYTFVKKMQRDVEKKYGVKLEPEVNIIRN
jgi:UDP-N-acetylmuramate dehydrogenase